MKPHFCHYLWGSPTLAEESPEVQPNTRESQTSFSGVIQTLPVQIRLVILSHSSYHHSTVPVQSSPSVSDDSLPVQLYVMKLTLVIKFQDYGQQSRRADLIFLTTHTGELFLDTTQHKFVAKENDSKPPRTCNHTQISTQKSQPQNSKTWRQSRYGDKPLRFLYDTKPKTTHKALVAI